MVTRLIVIVIVGSAALSGLVAGLVSWAVGSSISSTSPSGPAGQDGLDGPAGATGATGSPGVAATAAAVGPTGRTGPQGPAGAPGAAGASAQTFSRIEASGSFPELAGTRRTVIPLVGPAAAGPALVGFSIAVAPTTDPDYAFSCSLIDGLGNTYATSSFAFLNVGSTATMSKTEFVTLPAGAALTVSCDGAPVAPPQTWLYSKFSTFVISFAH